MSNILRILIIPLVLYSTPCMSEIMDDLVYRDGLYYKKFSDVPFTGEIDGKSKHTTDKGVIVNGKMDGHWIRFWNNGQLHEKGRYIDGKLDGVWVNYDKKGNLNPFISGTFEKGYRVSD